MLNASRRTTHIALEADMNTRFALRSFGSLIGSALFLVSGCADPPTQELAAAESALVSATEAEAPTLAPDSFAAAEAKLTEAKGLVEAGDYEEAKLAIQEVTRLAADARQEALDTKREAELAAEAERGAAEAEAAIKRSHTVVRGEYLWKIAGYEDVYGDPYQWPRIYNANRDQIEDPDLIYPDQVFTIPR
jgi:nucleoid-associated protein YgaU